jgi:hypothetical protein
MLDLEYLVTNLADFVISIPHDQVYALLSLASRQPSGRVKTKSPNGAYGQPLVCLDTRNIKMIGYHVDYKQPYDEFCKEFVQFSVISSSSVDIICRPWASNLNVSGTSHSSQGIELPTWIATVNQAYGKPQRVYGDIFVKLQGPSQIRYMSSGQKQVDLGSLRFKKYRSGWSMFLRGFVLDEVNQKSVPSREGNIPYEWPKFAKWDNLDSEPPDGYWRTLVADQGTVFNASAPAFCRRAVKEIYSDPRRYPGSADIPARVIIRSQGNAVIKDIMEKIESVMFDRSLARISHSEALGLVPRDTEIGDLICILYGCSVPVVLRRFLKTGEEIWEQRAENIREEQAAVIIQRAYRKCLFLCYKGNYFSATEGLSRAYQKRRFTMAEVQLLRLYRQVSSRRPQSQDTKVGSAGSNYTSTAQEGTWARRIRYSTIIIIFMCTTRVWPMDTCLGPPLGLLAFVILAFMDASRVYEHRIAEKENAVPGGSTSKLPARPRHLPLSLSKSPDPYYYKVIGESYVDGMMYGEAISLQEKEGIPSQVFELR